MQNNSFTNQLESYFSIITTKVNFVNQVKKEYSKILASDFNSLDFLYFGESKVSEILCFLLNPNSAIEKKEHFSILISNCVAVEKNKR